jgi:histidyl-tRNA synthetase
MATKISPISGFPEYLPAQQRAFDAITAKIRHAYESFGYTALETAAVERTEVLISKGIDAKEVYGLRRLAASTGAGDDDTTGAKELALRFDLTVPTARYVAQNYGQLVFPFRRHQIQPVWRGERPQKGRYRQFHQCDIDYIADGAGNLPLAADAEILACAYMALRSLGLKFTMQVNNRKFLTGLILEHGFKLSQIPNIIKIIDNYEKIGAGEIVKGLSEIGDPRSSYELVGDLSKNLHDKFDKKYQFKTEIAYEGLKEIHFIFERLEALIGKKEFEESFVFAPHIARGLDYYTGTVVETTLHDAPELGSICSGGRYENLAESLSDRALPGVGISIGLGRLGMWLVEQAPWKDYAATPAHLYVAFGLGNIAAKLRATGLKVEEGLEEKPLGKQLMAAEKRGLTQAVVGIEGDTLTLRTFATRSDEQLTISTLAKRLLGA